MCSFDGVEITNRKNKNVSKNIINIVNINNNNNKNIGVIASWTKKQKQTVSAEMPTPNSVGPTKSYWRTQL